MKKIFKMLAVSVISVITCLGMSVSAFAADVKATGISLNKETVTVQTGKTIELLATLTPEGATDAISFESSDTQVATVKSAVKDGKVYGVVTGVKAGEATITAEAGEFTATCKVTVEKVVYGYDEVLYTDAALKNPVEEIPVIYANGGKVKNVVINEETGETATVDYKQAAYYINLVNEAVEIKGKAKTGKFLTYVTLDKDEIPVLDDKGKITTTKEAKSVVSASVKSKSGSTSVVLKAGKTGGTAYVWVIDVKADKTAGKMVKIPVNVKVAPKSVLLFSDAYLLGIEDDEDCWAGLTFDDDGKINTIDKKLASKKTNLNVGYEVYFKLVSVVDLKNNVTTEDVTYKAVVDEKIKDYLYVEVNDDNEVYVYVKDTNYETPTKVTKGKITFICNQNGKKTNLTVSITNDIDEELVSFNSERYNIPDASTEKQTLTISYDAAGIWMDDNTPTYAFESVMNYGENFDYDTKGCSFATTDKIKLFVTSNDKPRVEGDNGSYTTYGYTLTKGDKKDTFELTEKSKEVSAKLDKTGNIILTAKKGTPKDTKAKLLYVVTHQDKTIDVYEAIISVGGEEVKIKPVILCKRNYENTYVKPGTTRSFDVSIRNPQKGAVLSIKCDNTGTASASVSGNTVTFKGVSANNGGSTFATLSYIIPATDGGEAVVLATRSFQINVISSFEINADHYIGENTVDAEQRHITIYGNFEIEKIEVTDLIDKDGLIKSYKVYDWYIEFVPSGKEGVNPIFSVNAYYDGNIADGVSIEVVFDK